MGPEPYFVALGLLGLILVAAAVRGLWDRFRGKY